MGTDIELIVDVDLDTVALDRAEREFHRLEAILSRFRDDSELSRLNRDGAIDAAPDLLRVIELALEARDRTDGRFDPTIHDALVAAGYDRTFEEVAEDGPRHHRAAPAGGGDVSVEGTRITLEPGVHVDLGGIAKGYAAERAGEVLATAGPCLVNAGGDIAVRGGAWPIGVEALTVELSAGGLATSGRDRRRWQRGGRELHHLIDPATGEPASSDILRLTVVAGDAVEAEVAATALFLVGADEALAEANANSLPAVIVTDSGRTLLAGGLE
jgi:thiamine biosynthesis lipoprotein